MTKPDSFSMEDFVAATGVGVESFSRDDFAASTGVAVPSFEAVDPNTQPISTKEKSKAAAQKVGAAAMPNVAPGPVQIETQLPPFVREDTNRSWRDTIRSVTASQGTEKVMRGHYGLTFEQLDVAGLGPKYQVRLDRTTDIIFSNTYTFGTKNPKTAVVGYVAKFIGDSPDVPEDKMSIESLTARTFYRDESTGIWRLLPTRVPNWHNRGQEADLLPLPARAQAAISEVTNQVVPAVFAAPEGERYFTGLTQHLDGFSGDDMSRAYAEELVRRRRKLNGNFYAQPGKLVRPDRVEFHDHSDGDEPDFEANPIIVWKASTAFANDVTFESITSKNQNYAYTFGRTKEGRAWLCFIEDTSDIQSTGVRKTWVDPGSLGVSIVEKPGKYTGHESSVVEPGIQPTGQTNMWPKYLKKVPVIARYLATR